MSLKACSDSFLRPGCFSQKTFVFGSLPAERCSHRDVTRCSEIRRVVGQEFSLFLPSRLLRQREYVLDNRGGNTCLSCRFRSPGDGWGWGVGRGEKANSGRRARTFEGKQKRLRAIPFSLGGQRTLLSFPPLPPNPKNRKYIKNEVNFVVIFAIFHHRVYGHVTSGERLSVERSGACVGQ